MSFLKLNTIPYYPELGKKLGGITPAILMRQLEYWFDKNGYKNFYKFLEPCDNGSYKDGDSWVEEIGISKAEFRNAFSKIGIVYKSKKEFKEAEDKFQGKPYCSYIDRMERRTYYIRNHEKVKEILKAVTNEDVELPRNQESESLEINKVDFQKSTKLTSRNQESEFPLTVDYQENTTVDNIHTEKIEKGENPNNDPVIIQQILKKYKELGLPEYEYRPDNYVILEAYNNLGAKKLLEALKIMSESEFVKNNLSINTIFKLDNLKKALNGNFKDKKKKNGIKEIKIEEKKEEKAEDYYSEEVLAALKGADYAKM